jgi:hypothetical protein
MFPDYHDILALRDHSLRPDRRPLPRASEIQLRVRRLTRQGA